MELREVADCLEKVRLQYMATVGLDGKPKVRPVQFIVEYDGWFCTNSKKSMHAELVKNPWIDLCGSKLLENEIQTTWIRLSAEAVFEENPLKMEIPSELVPHCPVCGKPLSMNLRCDGTFVEDDGWHEAEKRYQDFLEKHKNARTLFLELGVGENTPGIIKYPFWNLVHQNKNAFYASLNMEKEEIPIEIKARSVLIKGDIFRTIEKLCGDENKQNSYLCET